MTGFPACPVCNNGAFVAVQTRLSDGGWIVVVVCPSGHVWTYDTTDPLLGPVTVVRPSL